MKNINFFTINKFESLLETNSDYLFDCLILHGLDKKVLNNLYAVDFIINDFKNNYQYYCKYPKDKNGNHIPFSVYDLDFFFKSFIDKEGNYNRIFNKDTITLKVLDTSRYKLLKETKENEKVIKIEQEYVDNLETKRVKSIIINEDNVYKEISKRTEDIVTFNNTVIEGNKVEKNLILILPKNINVLESGILLEGTSNKYNYNRDFRKYTEEEKKVIVDAIKKIFNVENNSKEKQKILL